MQISHCIDIFLFVIDSDFGKLNVVDNLVDGMFYLVWIFYMLNYLEVQTGIAIKVCGNIKCNNNLVM